MKLIRDFQSVLYFFNSKMVLIYREGKGQIFVKKFDLSQSVGSSHAHLSLDFRVGSLRTINKEGMSSYICQLKAHIGLELKHACDQILKLFSEEAIWATLRVEIPEVNVFAIGKELEDWVTDFSRLEGHASSIQVEKNDSKGEQISSYWRVGLSHLDFGCCVAWSTNVVGRKS